MQLKTFADVDNLMFSVKRILEYTKLEIEDDLVKRVDSSEELQNWP